MNSAMTIDSIETRRAERDRPDERAADEQVDDAGEDGDGKRRQRRRGRRGTSACSREVDDAEAVQELDGRVAAERDEAPEHERVRQAGDRPLADRLALQDDVERGSAVTRKPSWSSEKVFGAGGDQADARRHLRREGADEQQHQDPEDERLPYVRFNAETR